MRLSLTKSSDIPLRDQLAEQIVLLITTGTLRRGEQLPSVRSLARQLSVHYNTVSEAYKDLVQRNWLTRRRGSRLVVGSRAGSGSQRELSPDELINESIQRAREMGYTLQALTEHVRKRLLDEPPDHILVIEEESGLREIIKQEVAEAIGCRVESRSPTEFAGQPELAVGAQVFAPDHTIEELKRFVPQNRPSVPIAYSAADEYVARIRKLKRPSVVGTVSVSESLLRTARAIFAPAIGRRHVLKECMLRPDQRADCRGLDIAFCDSVAMGRVTGPHKIHYRLVAASSLEHLSTIVTPMRGIIS
jgi:GntR family transcriptional regulator